MLLFIKQRELGTRRHYTPGKDHVMPSSNDVTFSLLTMKQGATAQVFFSI